MGMALSFEQDSSSQQDFESFVQRYLPFFKRKEPKLTVQLFLLALMSPIPRRNGWTLSEEASLTQPQPFQRLLRTTKGDWVGMRDESLRHARELFWDPGGVLVVDETGFLKSGTDSVGVQRQYTGTAGKRENCQIGVFISYLSPRGRILLCGDLYLPRVWANDVQRRKKAHVPEEIEFQTKPQIAARQLQELRELGWRAAWLTGDAVYGDNPGLRQAQNDVGQHFVLACSKTQRMWTRRPVMSSHKKKRGGYTKSQPWSNGPRLRSAQETVAAFHHRRWRRICVGQGSKGERYFDWAAKRVVHCEADEVPGHSLWLLARRSISRPHEIAYYLCFAPVKTKLEELARVAGCRWSIEECFRDAKQEVGLDEYQVRTWPGWHRHIQLCLLAFLFLAMLKQKRDSDDDPYGAWTLPECRRLFLLCFPRSRPTPSTRRQWIELRRAHNHKAKRSHYRRRQAVAGISAGLSSEVARE